MTQGTVAPGALGSLFNPQASIYKEYRLGYPRHVFHTIYEFAQLIEKRVAVDIGCGTGQVAVGLCDDFTTVIGLDSSPAQLEHATLRPNIEYHQAPAEATGLPAQSADLVVAAQCMHWFDVPAFYAECRRILRPTGAVAVFGYMPTAIYFPGSEAATGVLRRLHPKIHRYFHENRQRYLLRHYEGQEPTRRDFGEVKTLTLDMERQMSVEQVVGWVRSFSGWARYMDQHGEASMQDVLQGLQDELVQALGVPDITTHVTLVWPLAMILAKQPVPV